MRCEHLTPSSGRSVRCRNGAVWLHRGRRFCDAHARSSFRQDMCLLDVPRDRPYWVVGDDGLSERQEVLVAPWVPDVIAEALARMVPAVPAQADLFGGAA